MTEQTLLWIALLAVTGVLALAVWLIWDQSKQMGHYVALLAMQEKYRWPKPGVHCHSMDCFDAKGNPRECQCGYSDRLAEVA